ncbi:hypothetical protein [Virgibacillus halotolerans]|uniref:hypothetical protein n=1 Tax=Virgibacillus halotolerans TaxID=1071053 RepID=UPI0019608E01|nr:hypothetical protein [Virgibacillus halotolerans]
MGGSRNCGKTTELIKISHEDQKYIVCSDRRRVEHVSRLARQMNLDIPFPIAVDELPLKGEYIKDVLVDDIEDVFLSLVGVPIYQATSSMGLWRLDN